MKSCKLTSRGKDSFIYTQIQIGAKIQNQYCYKQRRGRAREAKIQAAPTYTRLVMDTKGSKQKRKDKTKKYKNKKRKKKQKKEEKDEKRE